MYAYLYDMGVLISNTCNTYSNSIRMVAYLKFIYVNVTEPPLSAKLSIYVCHIQHDMYSCMHMCILKYYA